MAKDEQRELFKWQWPPAAQYPLNNEKGKVGTWVSRDLKASQNYLILTGFSSLEYLIQEIGDEEIWRDRNITIVLGNEPIIQEELIKKRLTQRKNTLSRHIADYWLEKGISIKLNGPLLSLTKAIEDNEIQFRLHPTLHGKVYVGDHHLVMGSSNFSYSGMEDQAEINVRYGKEKPEYDEHKKIAEHYKSKSKGYNQDLLELLKKLLQLVNWEEALARAIAELLEGDWVEKYFKNLHPGQEFALWPTQRQAIGQALYILDNEGSVLIAEPTGSGKTRVGAHLLAALLNRFWQQGRGSRSKYKIIAPPLVLVNWQEELDNLTFTVANPISHGILSRLDSSKNQTHLEDIQDATVLLVDEAHNYLNISSNRTQSIRNNKADHVILFTATPINKKWNDLLRMVELLGLDNLSEEAYKAYKKLKRTRRRSRAKPSDQILGHLKKYSQKFIVRRTKREINEIIDRRPHAFQDGDGNLCRFPKHVCNTYPIDQEERDVELGRKIDRLSNDLKGILFLKRINMPKELLEEGVDPQDFVNGRIRSAPALSRYNIKNCLRSSRAALIEHLLGTKEACKWAEIGALSKTSSGNIIASLEDIDGLPRVKNIDKKYLPDWLTDEELYSEAVQQEIDLLSRIADCVKQMSDSRERSKAYFLADLLEEHSHILAFDEIVITHSVINKHIQERISDGTQLVIATGGRNDGGKEELQELFHPSSESSSVIGLCTDALSEGVNLQKSSAVVFLDMPTVIRKAEQRAGRVDRLDSPHDKIDIYWPRDHKVFQLEADKKFIERHDLVNNVIGSNIKVPDEFTVNGKEKIDPELMEELYKKRQEEDREWAGVDDAFKPVRAFIEEDGLIDQDLYEKFKEVTAKVLSRVSIVKSDAHWGFFAIRGTKKRAPKWVLIRNGDLFRDLPEICGFLRERLPQCTNITDRLKEADRYVLDMVSRLNEGRIELLPNRKRLALNTFEDLINKWIKNVGNQENPDKNRLSIYKDFYGLFQSHYKLQSYSIDCYEFSQLLLDVYHPYFDKAEEDSTYKRGRNINSLRELKSWLIKNPIAKKDLKYLWENLPTEEPLDKQVAAAIIAIPREAV
ncbi:SNF2-related protein [Aliifodinibius sp. S!AR15-10]|uniref:SNF2-related protein n=1 Tax=Aliifodinibius sp. S!AR15-10 TaxID=2950437 RepID=UPI00285BE5BA|nr:SNF2-related protein [Aliifodinibius sp. S!AR15-10]MDR8392252.1 SNF2-related protein [Aliifodinibius sp. S!AR15-10]